MTQPVAVIFDMDGVMVDSNPFDKIALRQFCRQHGHELTEEQLRGKIYGRTNKDWLTNLFGELPEKQLVKYAEEKEAIFRELYKNDIVALKGLSAFLDQLDHYKIPRAIATSAPRINVDFTLGKTGLEKYFSIILDETFVTRGKPDPEIYVKTAIALGLPNRQCIVIEDSISGVEAGKRAGSKVIGVTTTHSASELANTDYAIADFDGWDPKVLMSKVGLQP
jgi:beta-phosphoglucomutase